MEFRDLKKQYWIHKDKIDSAINKVLAEANFISGEDVTLFEKRLAEYVDVKHCITCANGTDALTLVLMAWGVNQGDAVFVPDFTFFATAEVVSYEGATPIFIDVDRQTFNMSSLDLEAQINRVINEGELTPKAIITVDLFGLPANYPEIERIAKKYNLKILEDGAQGFGGAINGKKVGSYGDAATTSFFPAKPLGCYGDGGAIFLNDDETSNLIKSLKVHGKGTDKYDNIRIGMNSRLDTIQAAILNAKLDAFIEHELEDVNKIASVYNNGLKGHVEIPVIPQGFYSSYAQYTIKLRSREERDNLKQYLYNNNIPTMIYYPQNLSNQKAFYKTRVNNISSSLCDIVLSLPMHPYLTEEEVKTVIETINNFFASKL